MKLIKLMMMVGGVVLSLPLLADQVPIMDRCREDTIADDANVQGRNEWVRKCGYITVEDRDYANRKGLYWTFNGYRAPSDPNAACVGGQRLFAMCPKGCYTADQRLFFNGEYIEIAKAAFEGMAFITSTHFESEKPSYLAQKIDYFTAGDTHKNVLQITTDKGSVIKVTQDHPMVTAHGDIVQASSLKMGDMLLSYEGVKTAITQLVPMSYRGKVWNIAPESQKKEDNVLISEGLLTGSVRFQNQWAKDANRLFVRKNIDVSKL